MVDYRINTCRRELDSLYRSYGVITRIYVFFRLLTAPLFKVEKYVPRDGRIADVGCGIGVFSHLLRLMSPERSIVGSDVSQKRVELAKKTVKNREKMSFLVKKADEFDFRGFSIVTVVDLIHHLSFRQHEILLKKIYEEIQSPGVLILKDLEKKPKWKYAYHYLQDSLFYRARLAIRSSAEMKDLLNKIGFRTKVIPLRSWLPYPHIVYVCKK